jgi:S1-C subfamily serine protease
VTAFHVVSDARTIVVRVAGRVVGARLVAAAPCDDTALLQLKERVSLRALPLAQRRPLARGVPIRMIGFPAASDSRTAEATEVPAYVLVSGLRYPSYSHPLPDYPDALELDHPGMPGMSGGPVVDRANTVVGMTVADLGTALVAHPSELAVAARRVAVILPALERGRDVLWPGFGLTVTSGDQPVLRSSSAKPGSSAKRAGFSSAGSRQIVSIGGRVVYDVPSYCAAARLAARLGAARVAYRRPDGGVARVRLPFRAR